MKIGPVTQQDIADKLNVTRITVSKALRNHPDISAEMKEKVLRAVEEMGYSPNLVARQLTQRKTCTIGVVIPDLENSFFAYIADSIIDAATDLNYHVIVTVSRENAELEKRNIQNLAGMRVDGLLVCISQETIETQVFDFIQKLNIPLVFFDRAVSSLAFSSIVYNDKNGSYEAVNQLIAAGYTKIAHFAGYSTLDIGRNRLGGYTEALKNNHLPVDDTLIFEGGYEMNDGYRAFEQLYTTGKLPELILAVNDRVALGAYKAIQKAGLRIPEDIGVVGFGFSETAQMFSPALAVINQDPRLMGRMALDMLMNEINSGIKAEPQHVLIEESFHWNTSIKR